VNWTEDQLTDVLKRKGLAAPDKPVDVSAVPFIVPADDLRDPVTINLAERPLPWDRAVSVMRGDHIVHLTARRTRAYQSRIKDAARLAMGKRPPIEGPVEFSLTAVFPIPKSWSKAKQAAAMVGEIRPAGRPDLGNVVKGWEDAFNGIVYRDDAQIVSYGKTRKAYGPQPLVAVCVRPV
jgi:Holliday junction resolvase RusA-like endonuclease